MKKIKKGDVVVRVEDVERHRTNEKSWAKRQVRLAACTTLRRSKMSVKIEKKGLEDCHPNPTWWGWMMFRPYPGAVEREIYEVPGAQELDLEMADPLPECARTWAEAWYVTRVEYLGAIQRKWRSTSSTEHWVEEEGGTVEFRTIITGTSYVPIYRIFEEREAGKVSSEVVISTGVRDVVITPQGRCEGRGRSMGYGAWGYYKSIRPKMIEWGLW